MGIINRTKSISIDGDAYIEEAIDFIRDSLKQAGLKKTETIRAQLLAEETIASMVAHAGAEDKLHIRVKHLFGDYVVYLHMKGAEYDPFTEGVGDSLIPTGDDAWDADSVESIRSILLNAYGEDFKYSHKNGTNKIRIIASRAEKSMVKATIAAMILGLGFGLLAKVVLPQILSDVICGYILGPFKTMFMSALKIVIAPVVFFSIVSCFSQFTNIAELGRLGAKVMAMYVFTTIIAVTNGLFIGTVLHPGEFGFALTGAVEAAEVSIDTNVDTSILTTIINIVPDNFVRPFVESDTLQLIFLAMLCGIALGMIGEYSKTLKDLFDACNSLFLTITTMIAKLIPIAVFCSVSLLVVDLGGESLISVLSVAGVYIVAVAIMLTAYGILVLLMGHQNPIIFFKKIWEGMLTSFTLSSSSASMPTNLRVCTQKLGISPKVANFSIPLGATVNMDGTCMYLSILGLFLARAYGVEVSVASMFSVALTIILLSLGAPGVPGAGMVCMGVVLKALNVPIEAIGLIIAIDPIIDMFCTMSNTTGDMTAALIVAKSEKLLDTERFKSKVQ